MPTSTHSFDAQPVAQDADHTAPEPAEATAKDDEVVDQSDPPVDGDIATDGSDDAATTDVARRRFAFDRTRWTRPVGYWILPALSLILVLGAGYLGWAEIHLRFGTGRCRRVRSRGDGDGDRDAVVQSRYGGADSQRRPRSPHRHHP